MPRPGDLLKPITNIATSTAIPAEGNAWDHSRADDSGACDVYCSIATSGVAAAGATGSGPATRI
jgi:hypothetical protein